MQSRQPNCSDSKSISAIQGSRGVTALCKPLQTEAGESRQSLSYVHIVVCITIQWDKMVVDWVTDLGTSWSRVVCL